MPPSPRELDRLKSLCHELWGFSRERMALINRLENYQIRRLKQHVEKELQRRGKGKLQAERLLSRYSGFGPRVDHADEFPLAVVCGGCGSKLKVDKPGPYRCPRVDCRVLGEVKTAEGAII